MYYQRFLFGAVIGALILLLFSPEITVVCKKWLQQKIHLGEMIAALFLGLAMILGLAWVILWVV